MLIRIKTEVILDVKDEDEAERACMAMEALDSVLRQNSFPHGEPVQTDVDSYAVISDDEAQELGLVED